jgi:hypothetical protein
MNPLGLSKNKSTVFILPIVFSDKKYSDILTEDFINAYIADFEYPEYDDKLTVVRKSEVERHDIPKEYFEDYVKIIAGAYNATSDKYKQLVTSFWDCDKDSKLYNILYSPDNKDSELIPPFSLSDEVYNIGVPL